MKSGWDDGCRRERAAPFPQAEWDNVPNGNNVPNEFIMRRINSMQTIYPFGLRKGRGPFPTATIIQIGPFGNFLILHRCGKGAALLIISAAFGIAFKQSLSLCSHLHEISLRLSPNL